MMAEKREKKGLLESIGRFFKDIVGELKKVVWPSKKQVINHTGIVLAFMLLISVSVSLLDAGITALLRLIFGS